MPKLSGRQVTLLILALTTLAGLATSLYRLGEKGLWGDEVWEAMWSRQQDLVATFLRFRSPPDHPLHFILTQISTWFSDSEFFVRLPSALLATGTVIVLFILGRRVFGTEVGLFAALLLAVAPYHVWYAQEARPYAALSFYSLLSLLFFWSLLERVTIWRILGFTIATCLNIYNHFFGLFPLLTEGLLAGVWATVLYFMSRNVELNMARTVRRRIWNTLLALGTGTFAALALGFPLYEGILKYISHGGPNQSGQIAPSHFDLTASFFVDLLSLFGAGPGWPFWIMFALFALGVGAALRSRQWFGAAAVAWIALPPVILWIAQPQHGLLARYLLFIQPVYLLPVAYGLKILAGLLQQAGSRLVRLSGRVNARAVAAVASLLAVSLWVLLFVPTVRGYGVEKVSNWSAACSYLWKHTGPGDIVTGDSYADGTLTWCFGVKRGGPYIPSAPADRLDIQDTVRQGRGIWYLNLDPSAPDLNYVRHTFMEISRSDWDNMSLAPPLGSDAQFYPETEGDVAIYHYSPAQLPANISFHEMKGSTIASTWPDYVEIPAGRSYTLLLSLPATAPRQLRVFALHLAGRPLEVSVDGVLLGTISTTSPDASWEDTIFSLPANVGDAFALKLADPGSETSAVSRVAVEWSSTP